MSAELMTRSDRETLVKIARQRERVAKSEARERAAHLMAEFETQLDRRYRYDENEVWEAATKLAKEAQKAAQARIEEESERLGIPRQFAPSISLGWSQQGRNSSKEERTEMRRVATRQVELAQKSAFTAIERQSLQIQEKIMVSGLTSEGARAMLETMPTVDALMPALTVDGVTALIASEKGSRA